MAAILSCRAMLNHRPLRRGCLIEFLYPTGSRGTLRFERRWRGAPRAAAGVLEQVPVTAPRVNLVTGLRMGPGARMHRLEGGEARSPLGAMSLPRRVSAC